MHRFLFASTIGVCLLGLAASGAQPGATETVGGWVVADGDIAIGRAGEARLRGASFGAPRWPGGRIPYEVAAGLKARDCLDKAIGEWNSRTPIRLVLRAGEANYLVFTPAPRSFTAVGLAGGAQPVFLEDAVCEFGLYRTMVHEIGHSVGLFHEHQRSDRDRYVRLQPEFSALPPQDVVTILGSPTGPYDFASVMHYGPLGGGTGAVVETIPRGMPTSLDQGIGPMLSPGDLDAIQRLYGEPPSLTTISTNPQGLDVLVDGERRTAPFTVNWTAGSQHTVDVASPQTREGARYEFGRWNDDGRQSHVVTAGVLTHLAANFITYVQVRGVTSDAARGNVSVDSPDGSAGPADGLRLIGTLVRVRATAAPGFFLRTWDAGRGSRNPLVFPVFHSDPAVNDFLGRFEPYPVTTLTSQPAGLLVTANGVAMPTPAQFRWEPGSVQSIDYARELVLPGMRYKLEVIRTEAPIQSPGRIIATPYDASITAIYRTEYPVRLSSSPDEGGQVVVTPSSTDGYVLPDDRLQIRALPSPGFRFARWRGLDSEANPVALTVRGAVELVAEFAPVDAPAVSVRNAASASAGPVAPGEIISLFLPGLPDLAYGPFRDGVLATEVSGVQVLVNDVAAPIVAVAPGQVNAIVPYGVAAGTSARVSVIRDGTVKAEITVPVTAAAPALFTANAAGSGQAAALNQDGSLNGNRRPAKAGEIVVLFGTGGGAMDPSAPPDGAIAAAPLTKLRVPVTVEIGGREARVHYAGPAPGSVHGLLQINAEVPAGVAGPGAAVFVKAGTARSAPGVTIAVE